MIIRMIFASVLLSLVVRAQGFPVQLSVESSANGWGAASMSPGADLNGDGIPEVVFLSSVGVALCDGADLSVIHFVQNFSYYYHTVSYSGGSWTDDVDGDGLADIIISRNVVTGTVFCWDGCTTTYSYGSGFLVLSSDTFLPLAEFSGSGQWGGGYLSLNDLNGDGTKEVIRNGTSALTVCDVQTEQVLPGFIPLTVTESGFVPRLATGQDLDGDGWNDLYIGYRNGGTGLIEIRSGNPADAFAVLLSIPGGSYPELGSQSGNFLHDINGDGVPEITGSYGSYGAGGAVIFSGADASVLLDTGPVAISSRGFWPLPDLDGDGTPEIGIAGWNSPSDIGSVVILRGTDLSQLRVLPGGLPVGHVSSFCAAGDHNGDGFEDLMISSYYYPGYMAGPSQGQVRVESVLGWHRYGDPADHALDLGRVNYASNPLQGPVVLSGGTPNGHGSMLGGFAADDMLYEPTAIPILVDTGADFLFLIDNLPLDGNGSAQWPVDLRQPALDGLTMYLQFFDVTNGLTSSNGLALRFTN
ncbi:MAG: VCBS repeat-containing protein [Planctomycetota bacterium]